MRTYILISMMAALPLVAQEAADSTPAAPQTPAAGSRAHGDRAAHRARLIEKFDTNKDGKLDDEEKAAMQKFIEERRNKPAGERGPRGGRHHGAPGQERPGREDFIKKFDKDQDGKLDDEEKAAMQKFIEERRNKPAGERGPRRGRRHGAPQGQE